MQTMGQPPAPTEKQLLLEKRPGLMWEADGVTNPGIARLPDASLAMVYRGCGGDKISYLGSCYLDPEGRQVLPGSRSDEPLNRRLKREMIEFPDGCGDPRVNQVGEWYYVWANGRNNAQLTRSRLQYDNDFSGQYMGGRQTLAFRTKDFRNLAYLGLHGPDEFDKNSFLHPTPIDVEGVLYWAFFHRMKYYIQVLMTPSVADLRERSIWREHVARLDKFALLRPEFDWEGVSAMRNWPGSIAGGTPPLAIAPDLLPERYDRRRDYWLHFYNASGSPRPGTVAKDRRVGAVVYTLKEQRSLDSQPFKVVARSPQPVLEAEMEYERDGPNGDVVFASGATITQDGQSVDVFYGSGDVAISKARFGMRRLLQYLCQFDGHGRQR